MFTLANSIAVAMYIIGFAESLLDMFQVNWFQNNMTLGIKLKGYTSFKAMSLIFSRLCFQKLKIRVSEPTAPGSQSLKYSRFVNKLFSNVPRVIKKIYAFINSSNNISTGCLRISEPSIFIAGSRLRLRNPAWNSILILFLKSEWQIP